ncbi:hypothetical protein MKOR_14300 [Mycolicibacillus koreensis]|nr:hypothetical protein MKOR_14300 [Mycolicibacillus koreensis]
MVGIDLSLTGTGIAAIDTATGELSTAIHSSPAPAENTLLCHVSRHRELVDGLVSTAVSVDPALVVIEGLSFSVSGKDSSLTRRGFVWWSLVEGLSDAGVPILEASPAQIKQIATGKGNAKKSQVVAAYALAWPDAARDSRVEDRADAAFAAALGAAYLGGVPLPFTLTVARKRALAKLPEPSLPPRLGDATAA